MDHGLALFAMIEQVLAGATDVAAFGERFYWYYFDEVPEGALSGAEQEFIEGVCEQLDLTAATPDAESRRFGWIDQGEFLVWLRARYADFMRREAS